MEYLLLHQPQDTQIAITTAFSLFFPTNHQVKWLKVLSNKLNWCKLILDILFRHHKSHLFCRILRIDEHLEWVNLCNFKVMVLRRDLTSNHFQIQLRPPTIVLAFKRDLDSQNNSRINFSKISKEVLIISRISKEINLKEAVQLKVRFGVKARLERGELWLWVILKRSKS